MKKRSVQPTWGAIHSLSRDDNECRIDPILRPEQEADLDATHFRERAARAREMAESGEDIRLSWMLLEVALDLDAEAEAIEAGHQGNRRGSPRVRPADVQNGLLHAPVPDAEAKPVQIVDLSAGGARLRVDSEQTPGSKVIRELPDQALRLDGTILRTHDTESVMAFDAAASADPDLGRILQSEPITNGARA